MWSTAPLKTIGPYVGVLRKLVIDYNEAQRAGGNRQDTPESGTVVHGTAKPANPLPRVQAEPAERRETVPKVRAVRMLDLFSGRFGWSKAFAARGWNCVGVDLVEPETIPNGCQFLKANVLELTRTFTEQFDFICASSPCQEFSVHGMKHFHPNPKYPELGIKLFNHTRRICEESGVPYVMENVRPAQQFVGTARHHCGPFYLWGNAVPPLMPGGISKGINVGSSKQVKSMDIGARRIYRSQFIWNQAWSTSKQRGRDTAKAATIPPELAACVADYAQRILEAV